MTDAELTETFAHIRAHSHPSVHPHITCVEAAFRLERETVRLRDVQIALITGTFDPSTAWPMDNERHSRKAGLRSVQ